MPESKRDDELLIKDGGKFRGTEKARKDGVPDRTIIHSIADMLENSISHTLGDLYRGNKSYDWTEFLVAVNYMIFEGLLEGRGDGFVVQYSLTSKAREKLGLI